MKKIFLLFCIACLSSLAIYAQNNRYYVAIDAAGANTGLSWADAFADLQSALQVAQAGDTIWVAEGTYHPTATTDRMLSFEPPSGIKIFGGFAGNEIDLSQRDWAAHPAILSGDIGVPGDSLDNSYNVVYLFEPDSNTVLDGLVIRDGVANHPGALPSRDRRVCGGGLYIEGTDADAYPDILNCRFEHNSAYNFGGGVMVNGSGDGSVAPRMINCRFEQNFARAGGAGMARFGGSWVERGVDLQDCTFERNHSDGRGGGFYYVDNERTDQMQIVNCRFIQNFARTKGGGVDLMIGRDAGSIIYFGHCDFLKNISSAYVAITVTPQNFLNVESLVFSNCNFNMNKDTTLVPTFVNSISYIDLLGSVESKIIIDSCSLQNNRSAESILDVYFNAVGAFLLIDTKFLNNVSGSGIVNSSSFNKVFLRKVTFKQNLSENSLLFIYSQIDTLLLENSFFSYNHINDLTPSYFINLTGTEFFAIKNCSFILNQFIALNNIPSPSEFFVHNTVFEDPPNYSFLNHFSSLSLISHCYLDPLSCSDFPPNYTCSNILTGLDPLFVNPDSNDYRLQPCSPLVNAGSNDFAPGVTDLAGQSRIQGGTVDIGAYETAAPTLTAAPEVLPACPGTASGAASFQPGGGCEPYQYAWSNAAGGSGMGTDGLVPGAYTFTVSDARGSTFSVAVSIPAGSPISLSDTSTPLQCGDTLGGSAAVTAANALPPLQFLWDNQSTDSLLAGLPPGEYAVTVTDAIGCTAAGIATVGLSGNLSVNISVEEISCYGAADGSLTALPANGRAPFTWAWQNGDTTATISALAPGDYTGMITDGFGCTISWFVQIGQPDSLAVQVTVTPASTAGAADGSIALDISGGTQPYTVVWSNGDTGPLADSLLPGNYTLSLTDAKGCGLSQSFSIVASAAGETNKTLLAFVLSPNPSAGQLLLSTGRVLDDDAQVYLLDVAGSPLRHWVLPRGQEQMALDLRGAPQGTYWVEIRSGNGVGREKLVLLP